MLTKVINNIEKYHMLQQGDRIIVGISGGADSVSLIHILHSLKDKYNLSVTAVHVNHCLRGLDADKDEDYVISFCNSLSIPVKVYRKDITAVAEKTGATLEEAGRSIRYQAFYDTLKEVNANKIAVAHNMNDNAETVLMRLCRGTGIKGMGGINPARDNIIRPLINITRCEIERYCQEHNLSFQTDYTNNIDIYTRNKIRLHLIPWLQQNLNRSIVQTLYKTSELMREEDSFLDKLAQQGLNDCMTSPCHINIDKLSEYDLVLRRRIVRLAYITYSADLHDIAYEHVNNVLSLMNKPTGKSVNLPHGLGAVREYDNIYIYKEDNSSCDFSYPIYLDNTVFIPEINKYILITLSPQNNIDSKKIYTNIFDYDKIKNTLYLRTRQSGDRIYLKGLNGTKTLKKLFIDLKIPRGNRDSIPIISDDNQVLWILGHMTSGQYTADDNTAHKLYVYIWEDKDERNG